MDVAIALSDLGTCDRKKVGAVIVRAGRCVSWGFNGAPPGLPHCDENGHGWKERISGYYILTPGGNIDCREEPDLWAMITTEVEEPMTAGQIMAIWAAKRFGCLNATHAEANALAFAARQGISTDNSMLFVTVSPCETCSRLLIAAGVREVFYKEEYRDGSGLELLGRAGVLCEQW